MKIFGFGAFFKKIQAFFANGDNFTKIFVFKIHRNLLIIRLYIGFRSGTS